MNYPGISFEDFFSECENTLAIDLLKNMLQFDPRERFTVEKCLQHPYLSELHEESDEPNCKRPFDYSFEDGYPDEMPKKLLQQYMFNEMLHFSSNIDNEKRNTDTSTELN